MVPHGLLLPVLPGTRHLTVGGAVAADVHGKNHRRDGSIASWIEEIELLDGQGELRFVSREQDPEAFFATVGGMGLTGDHPRGHAPASPRPQHSAAGDSTAAAQPGRGADRAAGGIQPVLAWPGSIPLRAAAGLGRGIVELGDHLPAPEPTAEPGQLGYRPGRLLRAPQLPFCPVTPRTARAFNTAVVPQGPRHPGQDGRAARVLSPARCGQRLEPRAGPRRDRAVSVRRARRRRVPGDRPCAARPARMRAVPGHAEALRAGQRRATVVPAAGLVAGRRPARRATPGCDRCWTTWTGRSRPRAAGYTWPRTPG